MVLTEPYAGSGEPLDHLYINLFIENGQVDEEVFTERRRLKLGKQITRDYAKTLKAGDVMTVVGVIGKVGFLFGDKEPPGWIEITLDKVKAESATENNPRTERPKGSLLIPGAV